MENIIYESKEIVIEIVNKKCFDMHSEKHVEALWLIHSYTYTWKYVRPKKEKWQSH